MIRARRSRAAGAALVTALVIAALTAAAAVTLASRTQLEIARTTSQIDAARRTELIARVEADLRAGLRDAAKSGHVATAADARPDHDYTARRDDMTASASVRDEQRRFNLNNLAAIPRGAGGQSRVDLPARDRDASAATARTAGGVMPSSTAVDAARSAAGENAGNPGVQGSADNGTSPPAGPEYVERTRLVLDPSVAKFVGGRGRPSELAALVTQGGTPRISETYLERVAPAADDQFAARDDSSVAATANAAASTRRDIAQRNAGDGTAIPAAARSPADAVSAAPASSHELWAMRFSLLLDRLGIEEPIAQAILDWVDADSEVRFPNGAEDAYYTKLETPYRAANRPFTDVSELLLVRGVTPAVYARLRPFVTVLPDEVPINMNTAPAEVLMSLAPGIDRRTAELVIAARDAQAFRATADLLALPMLAITGIDAAGIAVDSGFYTATTTLTTGTDVGHSRALIARTQNGRTRIVSRRQGYFND